MGRAGHDARNGTPATLHVALRTAIPPSSVRAYLDGVGDDLGNGVAVDRTGNAHVAGSTASADFPVTSGGFTYRGAFDAFATKLNGSGSAVIFSTFLGGTGDDFGFGVALSRAGGMHVTGSTASPDFPTTAGALQRAYGGGASDAFVTAVVTNGPPSAARPIPASGRSGGRTTSWSR